LVVAIKKIESFALTRKSRQSPAKYSMKLHTICHMCNHEFLSECIVNRCEMCSELTKATMLTPEQQDELYRRLTFVYLCMDDVVDSAHALHRLLERLSWYHEETGMYQACYLAMLIAPIEEPTLTFATEYFKCAYENSLKETYDMDDTNDVLPVMIEMDTPVL
jgi:hypothetical protein